MWFRSTSDNCDHRKYELLADDLVHVPVECLVQEADLEFDREGRHEQVLGDNAHLSLMRWNFI